MITVFIIEILMQSHSLICRILISNEHIPNKCTFITYTIIIRVHSIYIPGVGVTVTQINHSHTNSSGQFRVSYNIICMILEVRWKLESLEDVENQQTQGAHSLVF